VRFDGRTLVFAGADAFADAYRCLAAAAPDEDALVDFEADLGGYRSLRRAIVDQTAALVARDALTRMNLPDLMYFPDPYLRTLVNGDAQVRIGDALVTVTDELLGRDRGDDPRPGCYRNLGRWRDGDGDLTLSVEWVANLPLASSWLGVAGTATRTYRTQIVDREEHLVPVGPAALAARASYDNEETCERASDAYFDRVSLIQSNFGVQGNFEVVAALDDGGLQHFYRINDGASFPWIVGPVFSEGYHYLAVSLIQGSFFTQGNFELVAALDGGGIEHFYRDNDNPDHPWTSTAVFGGAQQYTGVSLVESGGGNLEVVASVAGGGLAYFLRWNLAPLTWSPSAIFSPTIAYDAVSMIYTDADTLEIVAAQHGGGLEHFTHPGVYPPPNFTHVATFGSEPYADVSLIQSNYGTVGNFEVVAVRPDGSMHHWFRDNDLATPWAAGALFGADGNGGVALIQSNYGVQGNFEVVTSQLWGGLRHYYRRNDVPPAFPWVTGPGF
jgi:hypothetical protein